MGCLSPLQMWYARMLQPLSRAQAEKIASESDVETLKRRIAELLVECKTNPYIGELMGSGRHPDLADYRRVRFDVSTHDGKPRFRLIYRNEPSDGAPAECRWLAIAPRAGLLAHRRAERRSRRP
jgi:hypothetical protein